MENCNALTECRHDVKMSSVARSKTTVYIDADVLRAAKIEAARTGQRDYEVFEKALREYLGFEVVERTWARSELSEKEALDLAYDEIHAARK